MAYFSTKNQIKTFEYRIHWSINIWKKIICEKINGSVSKINIQGSRINQKTNSTKSVMFCTGATFVNKNPFLVARIVSTDTVGLHLLTFRILEPYPSKDILILMPLL